MVFSALEGSTSTSTIETVTNALKSGITDIASDAMNAIAGVVPVALPVMGAIVVVGIGIRIFKKVSSKG